MGVSQLSSQATLKPVAEVSSSSIDAQRYYERGRREIQKFNFPAARRYLELAVKEDSTFAIAWFWLGNARGMLGDGPASKSAFDQAVKNASRATERERFRIAGIDPSLKASLLKSKGREGAGGDLTSWLKARTEIFPFDAEFRRDYAARLRGIGKVTQAIAEYEKALQLDPAFLLAYNELAYNYVSDGQGEKGMQVLERYSELEPGEPNPLHSMAECLLIQGRFDEGIIKCEAVLQVKPDFSFYAGLTLAKLHFMKEDYDGALKWSDRASEGAPASSLWAYCLWWRAWYLVWSGRLREAEETLRATEQKMSYEYKKKNITESDENDFLGGINWLRAWCAYEKGDWKKARLHFSNLPNLGYWPWLSQFCLGLTDLQQGKVDSIDRRLLRIRDILRAGSQRDTARSELDEETGRCFRNALQGVYLLAAGRPAEIQPNWTPRRSWLTHVPDSLTAASWPLCPPWGGEVTLGLHWIPIPFDILPRAYIERGMIDSAIASYERTLKKPPHLLGPIIPRYYYRLARLYEQKGMNDKAIELYTTFLKVWGKADPIYKEPADARTRLARLRWGEGTGIRE
jgi:tetratricopeptide (TPR) repeat protein